MPRVSTLYCTYSRKSTRSLKFGPHLQVKRDQCTRNKERREKRKLTDGEKMLRDGKDISSYKKQKNKKGARNERKKEWMNERSLQKQESKVRENERKTKERK